MYIQEEAATSAKVGGSEKSCTFNGSIIRVSLHLSGSCFFVLLIAECDINVRITLLWISTDVLLAAEGLGGCYA